MSFGAINKYIVAEYRLRLLVAAETVRGANHHLKQLFSCVYDNMTKNGITGITRPRGITGSFVFQ